MRDELVFFAQGNAEHSLVIAGDAEDRPDSRLDYRLCSDVSSAVAGGVLAMLAGRCFNVPEDVFNRTPAFKNMRTMVAESSRLPYELPYPATSAGLTDIAPSNVDSPASPVIAQTLGKKHDTAGVRDLAKGLAVVTVLYDGSCWLSLLSVLTIQSDSSETT